MTDERKPAVALRGPRSQDLFISPRVRQRLEQADHAFRLAQTMTNRADEEWLEQIARSFLEKARRAAEKEEKSNE